MDKKYCPRCNKDITDRYLERDRLFPACWYCKSCNIAVPDNGESNGELNVRTSMDLI